MIAASRSRRLNAWSRALFAEPRGFLWGALTNAVTSAIACVVAPHAHLAHLMILNLFGAVLISTRFGLAASAFTAVTGVLAFDYFCIPPVFAFALPDAHSVVTFVGMLITALTVCYLNHRLRQESAIARASESRTLALCELSLDLSIAESVTELPEKAELHLCRLFGERSRVLLRQEDGAITLSELAPSEQRLARLAIESQEPVSAVQRNGEVAFQAIRAGLDALGIIRVPLVDLGFRAAADQRVLLAACADRIGTAFERLQLGEAARRAQVEAEGERLRNTLLSAVSHDLKTPLSTILAAGTSLRSRGSKDSEARGELLDTIIEEAERLNGLVTNLLSVTRLESGSVRLNRVPEALDDLIFGVLSRLSSRLQGRSVELEVPRDLPLIPMDPVLVDQVLINLIENVLRYTPAESPLGIRVSVRDAEVFLHVLDRGPGISEDERERVFEKFYRGKVAKMGDGGSGLGLTICRAVARAHGGRIGIHARRGGGTRVVFVLPCPESLRPSMSESRTITEVVSG